jgi:hypothetical protein
MKKAAVSICLTLTVTGNKLLNKLVDDATSDIRDAKVEIKEEIESIIE